MTISQRLYALRQKMTDNNIDMYYIPTDDFHCSEYVGDFFKSREWISGFTGSAGVVIVTQDEAILWTDGRYFLQAEQQLTDTEIQLYKMGEPDVPTVYEYILQKLDDGQTLGMDGRTVTVIWLDMLKRKFSKKSVNFRTDKDLIGEIWSDRPAMSCKPIWELGIEHTGKTRRQKLEELRTAFSENNTDYILISSLDDIAWLLNLRGDDVAYNPVFLSHILVSKTDTVLFVQKDALSSQLINELAEDSVSISEYDDITNALMSLSDCTIQLDKSKTNCTLAEALAKAENVNILHKISPTVLAKACKNTVEIDNIREAHRKDGTAIVSFLHWLKDNIGKTELTEISAAQKLEQFRAMQKDYIEPSFDPISAYAEHGAIVHYSATEVSDSTLKPEGLLLMDTGGQYLDGTTDITRTIALGPLTDEMKQHFTAVLCGNLRLAAAVFRRGCTGVNLDILARQPLWELGLDYNHGTGHGVGFLLCCHEGPQNIRWRMSPSATPLTEGMVTSDEPGVYITGKYGIRLENLIVCKKHLQNEFGDFLCFDELTLVPFDLDAIIPEQMTDEDKRLLNKYHARVYDELAPRLNESDRDWLKNATRAI